MPASATPLCILLDITFLQESCDEHFGTRRDGDPFRFSLRVYCQWRAIEFFLVGMKETWAAGALSQQRAMLIVSRHGVRAKMAT